MFLISYFLFLIIYINTYIYILYEFYCDFCAVNSNFYSLNLHDYQLYGDSLNSWNSDAFKRTVEGLRAVLLALKKRPMIRHEKNSPLGKRLAAEINVC